MQSPSLQASTARNIERWFRAHRRPLPWRERYDPWHVWVSEVMLQQTRMEVVLPYFARFTERFPTLEACAKAAEEEVMAAWSGLGYYRRARMLRAGAIEVLERFGGAIPSTVDELLTIPGIGRYTAGAIASVAWNRRAPIVDGNVARILSRLFLIDEPVGSPALMRASWLAEEKLVAACKTPRDFNQGLMECGALICTPRKPSCERCPVREHCLAFAAGRADKLPRAKEKKATRELRIPLYIVTDLRGRVLMRRESGPLMNAMYHLPHGDTSLRGGHAFDAKRGDLLGTFRHTVTDRRITFDVYAAALPSRVRDANDCSWIDPAEMQSVPHPSYVTKALLFMR
ncbi:MAG TPA: A/G-specific adenine glycosylase [Thermoanaerobaculia bacterium]|nr:A/G-specific adenine glycosylase [Thermoanaerobaculia bacterium]